MKIFKKSFGIFLALSIFMLVGLFVFGNVSKVKAEEIPAPSTLCGQLLYFYTDTCPYCVQQKPIIEQIKNNFNCIAVKEIEFNLDNEYVKKYKVDGVPTMVFIGEKECIKKKVGYTSYENLVDFFYNAEYECPVPQNLPPVISEVSGPTSLKVNETGTWTIKASDPENGQLTYSVVWGDELIDAPRLYPLAFYSQTTTFTHSYSKSGNYTPTFTVTDDHNLSAKTNISVNVGDISDYEKCQLICKNIGTRSEGWYDSCTGNLIKYENCGGTNVCVKEGESLGAVVPDNNKQCCEGLRPYISDAASGIKIIGTKGICKKISDSQIIQPNTINIPYKDGTLLKSKDGKKIFTVDEEKLKYISSAQIFKNYGFKIKDVKSIASDEIKKYEISDEELLPYPNGTLLRLAGKVYFVQDEKLRPISSMKIFRAHNFKIKNIVNITDKIIDEYEMGENLLPYSIGTLLKAANRLYLVQGDEIRYISSLKAFKNLKRKNIIVVEDKIIDEFEEGEPLK